MKLDWRFEGLAKIICRSLRAAELFLPVCCLQLLLWPAAAFRAGCELFRGIATLRRFERLPASLRPCLSRPAWVRRLWRERARLHLTKLLCLWPNRLEQPRWKDRCHWIGLQHFEQLREQGHPIILAVLHFGPLIVLHYGLRSRGIPLATLFQWSSPPPQLRYLDRINDPAGRNDGLPHFFRLAKLREVYHFLKSGRVLMMAVDGRRGHHFLLNGNGFRIAMSTGMRRIAIRTGAIIIPCSITAERHMGFTVRFGAAVFPELVQDHSRHREACEHLLREFLPVLQSRPEQCSELLMAFSSTVKSHTLASTLTGTIS